MSDTPTDEELIAELEAAGVAFMAFRGGTGLTKKIWTTYGSQDAKKIATGIRAVLAKWGTPQPAPECHHRPPCAECASLTAQGGKV